MDTFEGSATQKYGEDDMGFSGTRNCEDRAQGDGFQGTINRFSARMRGPFLWKKVLAEAIGAFAIVFAGCGAIVVDTKRDGAISHVGVAIVFGLIVMTMIYAVGHVSGAHFNPAVTIAFTSVGRFPLREVPGYIVSQVVGATLGGALLLALLGKEGGVGATVPSGSAGQSLGLEIVCTFFLMFVISAVATDSRAEGTMAGIAIGGTVLLDAMFAGPICGASMNPARTLGPAFVTANFDRVWVYILGPIIGAVLGSISYELVRCHSEAEPKSVHGCCK